MGKFRQVIEIPGLPHKAPSPMGVRIGNTVVSGGIFGGDTETGDVPKDNPEKQAELLFKNIAKFMELAGGTTDHIAHVKLYVAEESYRQIIDKYWIEMFPDKDDRPARHAITMPLRGQMLMQAEIMAVIL